MSVLEGGRVPTSQRVDDDVGRGVDGEKEVGNVDDVVNQRRRGALQRDLGFLRTAFHVEAFEKGRKTV